MSLSTGSYAIATHAYFFREGDAVSSAIASASRARTSNVATIVTPTSHGLFTGAVVTVAGLGGSGYNAADVTITVVNATTFTYANTGSNESTTADTAGTVTLGGTSSKTNRPGPNDSGWIDMGIIEDAEDTPEPGEAKEVWGPSPGQLVLQDVIRIKPKLTIKLTCGEMSAFAVELLYRTLSLNSASTQFNPFEGSVRKGWLKLQRYDQNNNLRFVKDLWVELVPTGSVNMGGQDIVKPQFEATILHSTLNTAAL